MNTVQNIECITDLSLLVNTSLVDVVADKIRQNIYTGKYEAVKKLIVRELSEEFGVSHTPVKDALNRLISEGYVEALPRRSMVVRTYTNAELLDALEARMMCEVFYADAIIEMSKGHPELVKELEEVMATTRRLVAERGEHFNADWVANEVRFHRCYMLYCGNARVVKMHQDLGTNRITFLAYLGVNHTPLKLSTLECNLMEHQAIVDAIAAADSARFINAVTRHIARATDDYATDDECRAKAARIKALKAKYEV